jgi:hypothetical protein
MPYLYMDNEHAATLPYRNVRIQHLVRLSNAMPLRQRERGLHPENPICSLK